MKTIKELENKHLGEDIYVIGSGKSCDFIDPRFFEGKCVIGVNQVYKKFDCSYLIRKETKFISKSINTGAMVIVSEYDSGNLNSGDDKLNTKAKYPNMRYFKHLDNQHTQVNTSIMGDPEYLVVSFSTITSAMHLAAHMGAANIILVGADHGVLDGEMTFKGYYDSIKDTPWSNWEQYRNWLKIIESQTLKVKKDIEHYYDATVVSLNPFINFGLEGHKYER